MQFIIPIALRYGSILIQFLLMALVTTALLPDDAGIYFVIIGAILSSYFICGLGVPDGMISLAAELRHASDKANLQCTLKTGAVFSMMTALCFGVVFGAIIWIFTHNARIALFSGIWWMSYAIVYATGQILIADERTKAGSFFFYASINFTSLVIVGLCFWGNAEPFLSDVIAAFALSALLAAIASLLYIQAVLRIFKVKTDLSPIMLMMRVGWPIAIGRILQALIIWTPIWIAAHFISQAAAAEIGLASRLASAVSAMLAAIKFSVRPKIANHLLRGEWCAIDQIRLHIVKMASLFVAISIFSTVTIGPFLIPVIFGASYTAVWLITALFLLAAFAESIGGPIDEILKLAGFAHFVALAQLMVLCAGIGLQVLLAYYLGETGVALGFTGSFTLLYAVLYIKFLQLRSA